MADFPPLSLPSFTEVLFRTNPKIALAPKSRARLTARVRSLEKRDAKEVCVRGRFHVGVGRAQPRADGALINELDS